MRVDRNRGLQMLARLFQVFGIAMIVFGCRFLPVTIGHAALAASLFGLDSRTPPKMVMVHPIDATPEQMPMPAHLETPRAVRAGAQLFRDNCVVCHGAPGIAPSVHGLTPPPPDLLGAHRRNKPVDIFHKVANGIAGSAMPSFHGRLSDQSIWELAGFLHHSRGIMAPDFAALSATSATAQGK
jgi:mono/diheme cytochrome c family protein